MWSAKSGARAVCEEEWTRREWGVDTEWSAISDARVVHRGGVDDKGRDTGCEGGARGRYR